MAAQYAAGHADAIDGLALWGAYPADGTDLSESGLVATSVYATEDGLATVDEIEASAAQLPADTAFVRIEGGNHAGFGWYGEQDGMASPAHGQWLADHLPHARMTVVAGEGHLVPMRHWGQILRALGSRAED